MRNNKVVSYFIFWSMCLFYYSVLYSAIANQNTDVGDMSEGLVSILIFLATFLTVCVTYGDTTEYEKYATPRVVPIWLDIVFILINAFAGWYLSNFIIVFASLVILLTYKKNGSSPYQNSLRF